MKRFLLFASIAMFAVLMTTGWTADDVPAYHPSAPKKGESLPPILAGDDLMGDSFQQPVQVHAYELAKKIPSVIYQLPCYCRCDLSVGHKSLHSCFESTHGAHCGTCMQELYYAYQQTKLKKTPAQIRAGIINHEYEKVDLSKAASIQ